MTTSQNAYEFGTNATDMKTGKNRQRFFEYRKTMKISKYSNKKTCCG